MPPRTARLASLTDQVHDHLRIAIICAELQPGEKLVEMDIAAQMGTSQGPVREALQRLEHDGLVERRARSATFVTSISTDEMFELFSIRGIIEGFAIRHTAQKITAAQCDELDDLIQKMVQAGEEKEMFALSEQDMLFHRRIVEWSERDSLLRAWIPLSSQIQRFIVQSHPEVYPDYVVVGTRHQPIVDALRLGNAEAAVRAVRDHIMLIWPHINPDRIS